MEQGSEGPSRPIQPDDVYVVRQPVYDGRMRLAGYELLFRDEQGNRAVIADREGTSVLRACVEIGMESLVGEGIAFIGVSRDFLVEAESLPLPADRVVLEIQPDAPADDELLNALRTRWSPSFRLAVDRSALAEGREALLELAQYAWLDVRSSDRAAIAADARLLKEREIVTLAKGIEDYDAFEWCADNGFALFEGPFFCEPRQSSDGAIAGGIGKVRLLAALEDDAVDFDQLEQLIGQDIGLSFRLLRFINSAHFGLRRTVDSVHEAFVLLGVENVRRWASLVVLAGIPDKPPTLVVTALHRARTCELLARGGAGQRRLMFTVGLFSVIDALLDEEMPEVLARLPFSEPVNAALLRHEGPAGRVLAAVLAYGRGELMELDRSVATPAELSAAYLEAMQWADRIANELE